MEPEGNPSEGYPSRVEGNPSNAAHSWFTMLGIAAMSIVAVAGFAVAIYAAWLFHDLPSGNEIADYRPATSTRVFAWDGTLIGEYAKERRIFVPYSRIPPHLREAFLAAEDRNFFNHSGVDVSGIGRALIKDVINFINGKRLEGGSTITQQVAKNVLLANNERTIGRKLKEIILARRLEASLSKEQILELYLNDIYLGYRSNGVGTAAFNYFGKSVDDLTLAESAYLGALPKGPSNYHPTRNKEAAIGRRDWVIDQMLSAGWVKPEEAEKARKEDLVAQVAPERAKYKDADYFVSEVERRSKNILGDSVYSGGYYVKTTLNPRFQTAARIALMDGLEEYDRRHGWRGAWSEVSVSEGWQNKVAAAYQALPQAQRIPAERPRWQVAIVTGGSEVVTLSGRSGHIVGSDLTWTNATKPLASGDVLFVEETERNVFRVRQVPLANGAMVAMDPYSGRVLALVGGYSFSLSNYNRATQAMRQPGSSIKPFIYASALEKGFTPASIVLDGPVSYTGANGEVWNPQNYEHDYIGYQPLRKGIELSRNTMTVRLAQSVGMKYVANKLISFGNYDKLEPVLAMALGAGEITPYRMTASYAAFPNGGRRIKPHMIELVQDREGKSIYKSDQRNCPVACGQGFDGMESPHLPTEGTPVMDPMTAYQITTFLEGVVQRGTAVRALALNRPVAGKTGTTDDYRSAWFVGFTTDIVVGVFIGFDDNRSLGKGETGSHAALPVFVNFMQLMSNDLPRKPFVAPKDAVFVRVRGIDEAFKPGTEPKQPVPAPDNGPRPYLNEPVDEVAPTLEPLSGPKPSDVKIGEIKKTTEDLDQ
jgi:penicillin-binding protein 1A